MATLQDSRPHNASAMIQDIQNNWRQPKLLKSQFERWIVTSPPVVESLIATLSGGTQGAVLGGLMGQMTNLDPSGLSKVTAGSNNPDMQRQMSALQSGGPWVQARNFAVFSGVSAGITVAMRRFRKKEDVRKVMVAGFGSGAAFALISGMAGPNPAQGAFTSGVLMAVAQAAFYQIGKAFSNRSKRTADKPEYRRAQHLLDTLGMPQYGKNLEKGLLNDGTIWLWDDSALKEVRIPAGPRLVLLHHVDRWRNVLKPNIPLPGPPPGLYPNRPPPPEQKPSGRR